MNFLIRNPLDKKDAEVIFYVTLFFIAFIIL